MIHYFGGEVVSHDGVDVNQLNFKIIDHAALVCEADHAIVNVTVFIVVTSQSQTLVIPVLSVEMSHEHAFAVSCSEEGGDEEKYGASVIFQQVLTLQARCLLRLLCAWSASWVWCRAWRCLCQVGFRG